MDRKGSGDVGETVRNLKPSIGFDLDDLAAAAADQQDPAPLLHMNDLTYILNHPEWLPDGFSAEQRGDKHWAGFYTQRQVTHSDNGPNRPMTTLRARSSSLAQAAQRSRKPPAISWPTPTEAWLPRETLAQF